MGTDSLVGMKLRNLIRKDLGVSVAIFDLLGGADTATIGDLIAKKLTDQIEVELSNIVRETQ